MNDSKCSGSMVVLAPRSIASQSVWRNDENVMTSKQTDWAKCHRIGVKVKRKSAVNGTNGIKCDEIRRKALSNLNNATHGFVQVSKNDGCTSAKLMVKSVSKPIKLSARTTIKPATMENVERQTKKCEAKKYDGNTAMTTTTQNDDKFCQYSTAMNDASQHYRHQRQQQKQKKIVPVLKSVFQNVPLRQTKTVTRAMTQAHQHYIYIRTSNEACHRPVAIPKDCHTANVNVLRKNKNGQNVTPEDL